MKKISSILMALMLLTALSGCSDAEKKQENSKSSDKSSYSDDNSDDNSDDKDESQEASNANPLYLDEQALDLVPYEDKFGYLSGNLKAMGNFFDYKGTPMLTKDNRMIMSDYHEIIGEIEVPEDVVDFAEIN